MNTEYTAANLLEFAVKIEEEGASFYKACAEKTGNRELQQLFKTLENDELRHRKTYAEMLGHIAGNAENAIKKLDDRFKSYMSAIVKHFILKESAAKPNLENEAEILEYAIGQEMDSILFYTEVGNYVDGEGQKTLNHIIEEERHHIVNLQRSYAMYES